MAAKQQAMYTWSAAEDLNQGFPETYSAGGQSWT